jgi:hypothetical protein
MADGSASFADSGHTAAAANAFASAHMHTAGGDNSGIWGTVVDKLQIFANACGMSYDTDTTAGEKVGQVNVWSILLLIVLPGGTSTRMLGKEDNSSAVGSQKAQAPVEARSPRPLSKDAADRSGCT